MVNSMQSGPSAAEQHQHQQQQSMFVDTLQCAAHFALMQSSALSRQQQQQQENNAAEGEEAVNQSSMGASMTAGDPVSALVAAGALLGSAQSTFNMVEMGSVEAAFLEKLSTRWWEVDRVAIAHSYIAKGRDSSSMTAAEADARNRRVAGVVDTLDWALRALSLSVKRDSSGVGMMGFPDHAPLLLPVPLRDFIGIEKVLVDAVGQLDGNSATPGNGHSIDGARAVASMLRGVVLRSQWSGSKTVVCLRHADAVQLLVEIRARNALVANDVSGDLQGTMSMANTSMFAATATTAIITPDVGMATTLTNTYNGLLCDPSQLQQQMRARQSASFANDAGLGPRRGSGLRHGASTATFGTSASQTVSACALQSTPRRFTVMYVPGERLSVLVPALLDAGFGFISAYVASLHCAADVTVALHPMRRGGSGPGDGALGAVGGRRRSGTAGFGGRSVDGGSLTSGTFWGGVTDIIPLLHQLAIFWGRSISVDAASGGANAVGMGSACGVHAPSSHTASYRAEMADLANKHLWSHLASTNAEAVTTLRITVLDNHLLLEGGVATSNDGAGASSAQPQPSVGMLLVCCRSGALQLGQQIVFFPNGFSGRVTRIELPDDSAMSREYLLAGEVGLIRLQQTVHHQSAAVVATCGNDGTVPQQSSVPKFVVSLGAIGTTKEDPPRHSIVTGRALTIVGEGVETALFVGSKVHLCLGAAPFVDCTIRNVTSAGIGGNGIKVELAIGSAGTATGNNKEEVAGGLPMAAVDFQLGVNTDAVVFTASTGRLVLAGVVESMEADSLLEDIDSETSSISDVSFA